PVRGRVPNARARLDPVKIDGGCHCGKIHYEDEVDPGKVLICHCTDCQTLSGSAFRTVVPSNEGSFRLLSGTPRVYVKTAETGRRRVKPFGTDCGTPIYSATGDGDRTRRHDPSARSADPERSILGALIAPWLQHLARMKKMQKPPNFDPKGGLAEC